MDAEKRHKKIDFKKNVQKWRQIWPTICDRIRNCWAITWAALCKYDEIDGEQRAAAFAYYAFFALFPLILLFVSLGSLFWDQIDVAPKIIDFVGQYIPVPPDGQNIVTDTVNGVVQSRSGAGLIAFLALAWSALRFFQALVRGVNRAWGTVEYSWWRLPIKNLGMVGILGGTLLLGIIAPLVMKAIESLWQAYAFPYNFELIETSFKFIRLISPTLILFVGFIMFYKFAPRRRTRISEIVWASLVVTFLLQMLGKLFVIYAQKFANFNALYGTLGSVIALLMWIYLSGSIIILGACFSAVQLETKKPQ